MPLSKKLTVLLCSALCYFSAMQLSYADNFNYASPGECGAAMDNYREKASDIAFKSKPFSKEWEGFMNMSLFFNRFIMAGSSKTTCINGICTFESEPGCGWATSTDKAPWKPLITQLLSKEVDLLNASRYDADITSKTYFLITCTYPEKSGIDWNQCKMAKVNYMPQTVNVDRT